LVGPVSKSQTDGAGAGGAELFGSKYRQLIITTKHRPTW